MDASQAKTHAMRALIELRHKILSGELSAGTRLLEVPMAEALAISRTPVREAMSRLVEEGLLERVRGGGFVVRRFGMSEVIDSIELRGVLEGTAARLAAERGPDPDRLVQIRDLLQQLDGCFSGGYDDLDFERYADLNARFHETLVALAGSEVIRREVERVTRLPFASPTAFLQDSADVPAFRRSLGVAQDQHRALVEAIAAREGARAEALAREHARLARRNLEYVFAHDPKLRERVPGLALVVD